MVADRYSKLTNRGKWLTDVLTLAVVVLGAAALVAWAIGLGRQ